jgi:putative transposase
MKNETTKEKLPQRRKPASGVFVEHDKPTIVFVTVCTRDRAPWLTQTAVHDLIVKIWQDASVWSVGFYLLMPDHVHLFCSPHNETFTLEQWVTYWKRDFTRRSRALAWRWQSGKWDTRLRRSENYRNKWEYVRLNPVRKGLVTKPEDWPYQGILNELRW